MKSVSDEQYHAPFYAIELKYLPYIYLSKKNDLLLISYRTKLMLNSCKAFYVSTPIFL